MAAMMDDKVKYLLSLEAIRGRASIVYKAAQEGKLSNFDFHPEHMEDAAAYVAALIDRDFGPDKYDTIPPHGRWQHCDVGNVPRTASLLKDWKHEGCDMKETTRRMIDLFFVSVLLDAGAGDTWLFTEPGNGNGKYGRSEGIAVASLHMFSDGKFADPAGELKTTVNARGLELLTPEILEAGLQVSSSNPMPGVNSRAELLRSLGASLKANPDIFGETGRPGNIVDFLIASSESKTLDVKALWDILQTVLIPAWPSDRTCVAGIAIGDAWPLKVLALNDSNSSTDSSLAIQPFHKLTQWLTYSLMVPFERILKYKWTNTNLLTGLPEYRNGGLFVDMGVLTLKPGPLAEGLKKSGENLPKFETDSDVIVEWRAMTVSLLDALYKMVLARLSADGEPVNLSMAQLLEAGTWKSGRELAAKHRPSTNSSPILIASDGTLF